MYITDRSLIQDRARMADDGRTFVVGDIHGCAVTFSALLNKVLEIDKKDIVYLLGDYIDRGLRSRNVVDIILGMMAEGYDIRPIMGNHEVLLLQAIESPSGFASWMRNGATSTLKSFNVSHPMELEEKYKEFFSNLPYYYMLDEYIIVHGGLNFDIDNPLEDIQSMVWERNHEVFPEKIGGRKLIVGHTPVTPGQITKSLSTNKIMLDGGCVYLNYHPGMGYLCALEINSMKLYMQLNIE